MVGENMIKKIIKLLLILVWMGVIFSFSSDNGAASENKSNTIIMKVYKVINKEKISKKEEQKIIDKYVLLVRKSAHFLEYAILGLLVISFINEFKQISIKSILIAILVCILYATSDEIHQLFSSGRSARIFDVIIDTLGSSTSIIIYYFINNKLLRRKANE